MPTLRYNPVTMQWSLLGGHTEHTVHITHAHIQEQARHPELLAACYPNSPFALEGEDAPIPTNDHLLYAEEPAVGEYELMLYRGDQDVFTWDSSLWQAWVELLQSRLLAFHRNPYLHSVRVAMHTGLQQSAAPAYRRVGDLIATSRPLSGHLALLSPELIKLLLERESAFTVFHNPYGSLQAPSAPTHADELWYLPNGHVPRLEAIRGAELAGLAKTLEVSCAALRKSHLNHDYVFTFHTTMGVPDAIGSWWLQMHRHVPHGTVLPVQTPQEQLVQRLRYAVGSL